MAIILTGKGLNSLFVAKTISNNLDIPIKFIEDDPKIDQYDEFFFVVSNRGDEELPECFENFLNNLITLNKKYYICEIGNYFGFEYEFFGSRKIVDFILKRLGWEEVSSLSVDSMPAIDEERLIDWIDQIKKDSL
jgi:flavodoxin